ncbi:hypothetical protein HanXRQr2_Chr04g0151151 [Helianthus annuus]|uniref:Uncharacterized protein n=1 Tax=Helianthus annuus TaxID=4232 RepID=A0A9K3J536_HELAN|nr:hypothetical protein HanXRQr2_Chr04g0151151 [Helianthus annuus]KAJ0580009.1 hypothetical protein HanHA300_Chr04g0124331 [Helianthus annuus]KAJ0595925.1 hypothetical protein HanHA89_Chr04g0136871 [Helianthus annuus]
MLLLDNFLLFLKNLDDPAHFPQYSSFPSKCHLTSPNLHYLRTFSPFHPFPEDVKSSSPSLRSLSSPPMMTSPLSKSPQTFSSPVTFPSSSSSPPVSEQSAKELGLVCDM